MHAVLVQAGHLADVIADDLHEIQHVEIAVDLDSDGAAARQHADEVPRAQAAGARNRVESWRAEHARESVP